MNFFTCFEKNFAFSLKISNGCDKMNRQKDKTNCIDIKEGEVKTMAVLSRPVGVSFDLNPSKAKAFLKKSEKSACQRAIERASAHKTKNTAEKE